MPIPARSIQLSRATAAASLSTLPAATMVSRTAGFKSTAPELASSHPLEAFVTRFCGGEFARDSGITASSRTGAIDPLANINNKPPTPRGDAASKFKSPSYRSCSGEAADCKLWMVFGAKHRFAGGDRKDLGLGNHYPANYEGLFEEQIQCIIVLHLRLRLRPRCL